MPSLQDMFSEVSIYKSIIITESIQDCWRLKEEWGDDVDMMVITTEHLEDERPLHLSSLRLFRSSVIRCLCITFNAWLRLSEVLESYVMDHNMLYLYDIDPVFERMCLQWVKDCHQRGLRPRGMNYWIASNNFLLNMVE
jgi:hypothetical protein